MQQLTGFVEQLESCEARRTIGHSSDRLGNTASEA